MTNSDPSSPAILSLLNDDGQTETTYRLAGKNSFRLGRIESSDIPMPFSWVSRQHAIIQIEENGVHNLIDLGSSNGTFINGKRVQSPTRLHSGDTVGIGRTSLLFIQEQEPTHPKATFDDRDGSDKTVAFVQKALVTVLICDIHGYTRLSEILGDALISKVIRIWSNEVGNRVRQNDGIVDKFLGDAVMAIWYGGSSPRHNILQALKTAVEISQVTRHLGDKIPQIPGELTIGAAINTGEAILGNVGSDGRRDFTVIGDAVNIAFRLESMTNQTGQDLLMGKDAAAYLDTIDGYFTAGDYFLKGKEKKVPTYGWSFPEIQRYLAANTA